MMFLNRATALQTKSSLPFPNKSILSEKKSLMGILERECAWYCDSLLPISRKLLPACGDARSVSTQEINLTIYWKKNCRFGRPKKSSNEKVFSTSRLLRCGDNRILLRSLLYLFAGKSIFVCARNKRETCTPR